MGTNETYSHAFDVILLINDFVNPELYFYNITILFITYNSVYLPK